MKAIPGYKILEKISEGGSSIIFRAVNQSTGTTVILKVLKGEYPPPAAVARYRDEFEIIRKLSSPYVIQASEFIEFGDGIALVLEDFQSVSLDRWLNSVSFDLLSFLNISIQIASALDEIHQAGVIHYDIKPENILINPDDLSTRITDFGLSVLQTGSTESGSTSIEGSFPFISPERTGRIDSTVDHRSDLYSLGVTLYRMFTGRLPFVFNEIMELIHAHLALLPADPLSINPQLPPVLGRIILRLLEKNQENRYQGAGGLKRDLTICRDSLVSTGMVQDFQEGKEDRSPLLVFPSKLYGRDQELASLKTSIEQAIHGLSRFLLIEGEPGIGKTSLVNEARKQLSNRDGYFIQGKFDLYSRSMPYSALNTALSELVRKVLFGNKETVEYWRSKILRIPGLAAGILTQFFPDLEMVVGKQPGYSSLPPVEMKNQLSFAFRNFIRTFSQSDRPLVLFMDDLQWIDASTLDLLKDVLLDPGLEHFLLIGSFRSREVDASHMLTGMVQEVESKSMRVDRIHLKKLEVNHVRDLIQDTFSFEETDVLNDLSELLYARTDGSPLFVQILIKTLCDEGVIYFQKNQWNWDRSRAEQIKVTENVLELMNEKLLQMPDSTLQILKKAACLGGTFRFSVLSGEENTSVADLYNNVKPAIQEGYVIMTGHDDVTFVHDRIREAIYSMIAVEDRPEYHYNLGKAMLRLYKENTGVVDLFSVTDQLNIGRELIKSQSEKLVLSGLNLEAGVRAKESVAYDRSLYYFRVGVELLPSGSWDFNYTLSVAQYMGLAESEYLNSNLDSALENLKQVFTFVRDEEDLIKAIELKVAILITRKQLTDAIHSCREGLARLGVSIPRKPGKLSFALEVSKTKRKLKKIGIENLTTLKQLDDPRKIAAMRLLMAAYTPAYIGVPDLAPIIALKMVNISLEFGNSVYSPFAYMVFAMILGSGLGDYASGYATGNRALELVEKPGSESLKAKLYFFFPVMVNHWSRPVRETLEHLKVAYRSGLETGDFLFASYSINHIHIQRILLGDPLFQVVSSFNHLDEIQVRLKIDASYVYYQLFRQIAINLSDREKTPLDFNGEHFDQERFLELWKNEGDHTVLSTFYVMKALVHLLLEKPEEALFYAKEAEKHRGGVFGMLFIAYGDLVTALSLLSIPRPSFRDWRKIQKIVGRFKIWATNAPGNYSELFLLISAEIAVKKKEDAKAIELFEQAIQEGGDSSNFLFQGLTAFRAARYHETKKRFQIAKLYYRIARYSYQRMDANSVIRSLDEQFSGFRDARDFSGNVEVPTLQTSYTSGLSGSTTNASQRLDLETILKSSQMMSESLLLEHLLSRIMKILMENAGAQRGFLIMVRDGKPWIEAGESFEGEVIPELQSVSVDSSGLVASSIVHYVIHTDEQIVLRDASREGIFTDAPYVVKRKPRSILCMPVIKKDNLHTILYLENNLTAGAFTTSRINILSMLSSQAAISLENSFLYEEMKTLNQNLEKRVAEEIEKRRRQEQLLIQQSKLSSMGEMIVSISHHWRQPLSILSLQIQNLEEMIDEVGEVNRDEMKGSMSVSLEQIRNMSNILDDFSRFFERSDGIGEFDAMNAVCEVLHLLIPEFESNHITLRINGEKLESVQSCLDHISGSWPVLGFANEFKHVVTNIIYNARDKIMERSRKEDESYAGNLDIRILEKSDMLHIEVEDNGGGVSYEERDRIYEPYYSKKSHKGKGLGLYMGKIIIEQDMNGSLYHENGKEGAVFCILLPAKGRSTHLTKNGALNSPSAQYPDSTRIQA